MNPSIGALPVSRLRTFLVIVLTWLPFAAASETYLLMAEESGCIWCARWHEDIAHIYPKTAEGQTAPLRRYDLHKDMPEITFTQRVRFTPTFILVENGSEVGRIEGYPGEDFFWGLLNKMFERAGISLEQAS